MIGMSRLGDLSKLKLQPKKKEQVYDELNELRIQLGLSRTNGDMSMTRKTVKRVYFDTSAFVKIFIEEEASEKVERLVTLVRDKKIIMVISDWVINESIAVIDANNNKGIINAVETQQILSEMTDMIEGKVR